MKTEIKNNQWIARVVYPIDITKEMIESYFAFEEFIAMDKLERDSVLLDIAENFWETSSITSYVLQTTTLLNNY